MKKLLYLLLVACFATTTAFAYDDDEDDEEEVAAPKKAAKAVTKSTAKKAAKKASEDGEGGEYKFGFYGSIAGGMSLINDDGRGVGLVGLLFNLGSGLEIGLGIGFGNYSRTIEEKWEGGTSWDESAMAYEIVPSISYQLGKVEAISYGAGLDIHLSNWSQTTSKGEASVTFEPTGMDMAFYPNFYIRAELVKNFQVGLKTGLVVNMQPEERDPPAADDYESRKTTIMGTIIEVGFNYYIDI